MGEAVAVVIALSIAAVLVGGALLGIVAFILVLRTQRRMAELARRLDRPAEPPAPEPPREEVAPPAWEAAPVPPEPPPVEPAPAAEEAPSEEESAAPSGVAAWARRLDRLPGSPAAGKKSALDWAQIEGTLGTRWMTWAGVLALFVAVAFGVKHAFERGWIGPPMRVGLGIAAGLALLVLGDRSVRRDLRAFGQTFMGGGLAMLYASLFAAFAVYDLVLQPIAFGAMVLVTAGGMTLAVRHDALAISFMAVLGGVLTPVLLSTGVDARDELFTYLLLLDLGVFAVALFRRWRALDALAFAGTALLFAGWFVRFYQPPAMVPALAWLGAFYVLFLVLPFIHHLRHGEPIPVERVSMSVANAILGFGCAYAILGGEHEHALGFIAMAMSACYVVLAVMVRRRIPDDVPGVLAISALAVALLSVAVPLHLNLEALAIGWAVEAPLLVYLGYRYRYRPLRTWAILPLLAAAVRVATLAGPRPSDVFTPVWNPLFGTAMAVAVAAWVFAVVHHLNGREATGLDRFFKRLAAIAGGLFALLHVQDEGRFYLYRMDRHYLARCTVAAVWTGGALAYLASGLRFRSSWALRAGLLPLATACGVATWLYSRGAPHGYLVILNARFGVALAAAVAVFCYGFLLRRFRARLEAAEGDLGAVLLWVGAFALLALLSADAYVWCKAQPAAPAKAGWTALMSLSLVWGLYAAAMLALGFWRRSLPVRMAALGLFAATALKLVMLDLVGIEQVYRIISFLVLGALMVGAAYVYHRVERRFEQWAQHND